jgi:hypothetical protein
MPCCMWRWRIGRELFTQNLAWVRNASGTDGPGNLHLRGAVSADNPLAIERDAQ